MFVPGSNEFTGLQREFQTLTLTKIVGARPPSGARGKVLSEVVD